VGFGLLNKNSVTSYQTLEKALFYIRVQAILVLEVLSMLILDVVDEHDTGICWLLSVNGSLSLWC